MVVEDALIRRRYWPVYFLVYVVVAGVLLGLLWGDLARESPLDRMVFVSATFGASAGASAGIAILVEMVGGLFMLIMPEVYKWIKAKGRKEAAAERDAEWDAWLTRYREAQAEGQEFTEPPPSARNGHENSS